MSDRTAVVVTGASGLVGTVLRRDLADRFDVGGVDIRRADDEIAGRPVRRANLARPRAARRAIAGADVVVALAGSASTATTWRNIHRRDLNIVWNTLLAAHATGARRVVLASTNNVTGGYEHDEPYRSVVAGAYDGLSPATLDRLTTMVPVRPNGAYAVGKVFAEAAGRYFADMHDLSVIALRIGTVRPSDRPEEPRHFSTLLTHRDLVALVECCIDAPDDLRFGVFYGVSANTWRIWEIDDAARLIGYAPVDDAEQWRNV